jgi:hypothetical protein
MFYRCTVCLQGYRQKAILDQHLRTHTQAPLLNPASHTWYLVTTSGVPGQLALIDRLSFFASKHLYSFLYFVLLLSDIAKCLHPVPVETSVVDPIVFGPPRSGSFHHQAKIIRKNLISTLLWLLYDFLSLKYVPSKSFKLWIFFLVSWRSLTKRAVSGSVCQWYGSTDPDPYRSATDPQHC